MTRAQRHQLRRHWREPREKETDAGETRDAGTCVSHGLPMATHAANVRGYRPYSFRTTLPVHVREKRTYSIRNSVGCTTRTTTRLYNGKREVRFVCVHTRGRVNWFRLRVRCHDVAIRSKHAMKPRYRRLRAPRRDILTIEWGSFGHNPLCKEVGEWNTYTISSLALNWKTMLTFSCFPCICSFLFFFSNRSTVMTVCHWTLPISKYQSWHRFHYVFRRFFQYIFRFCAYLFILRDKRTRIISSNDSNYRKLLSSCSTQNYQINRDPKKNSPLLQFARMFHFSFVHRSSYRDVRDHVPN